MYITRHDDNAYVPNASRCCDFSGSGPPDVWISGSGPLDVSISLALVRQILRFLWLWSARCFDFSGSGLADASISLAGFGLPNVSISGSGPPDVSISLALVRSIFGFLSL